MRSGEKILQPSVQNKYYDGEGNDPFSASKQEHVQVFSHDTQGIVCIH